MAFSLFLPSPNDISVITHLTQNLLALSIMRKLADLCAIGISGQAFV